MWIYSRENDVNTVAINTDNVVCISISSEMYKGAYHASVLFESCLKYEKNIIYDTEEHAEKAYNEIMDAIIRGETYIFAPADGYLNFKCLSLQ